MQKISKIKTATAYASAWLEAAKGQGAEDKAFEDAKALAATYHGDEASWLALGAPVNDAAEVLKTLGDIAKKAKLAQVSAETLAVMAENGRLNLAGLVFETFIRLYYADKGIIEVKIDTATALTETQDKKLKKVLEEKLNSPVILEYSVNPDVLGGLSVRYGSVLFDDTLAGKINRIEKIMKGETVGR